MSIIIKAKKVDNAKNYIKIKRQLFLRNKGDVEVI